MKIKFLSYATIALFAITSISCSKSDPDTTTSAKSNPNVIIPSAGLVINTGDLKIIVIDTAKINTVTKTGSNETTIVNRNLTRSSSIGDFSISDDGTKFVYIDVQYYTNNIRTSTIRVANINGTNDAIIYTAPANTATNTVQLKYVKFGASKIFFASDMQTIPYTTTATKISSVNFDGTGLMSDVAPSGGDDISYDGKYIATLAQIPNTSDQNIIIVDRAGNSGAGTLYHAVAIPSTISFYASKPVFSFDGKFVYYSYIDNQNLKVNITDIAAKTSQIKTIATGIPFIQFGLNISVASDNNRGIVTVKNFNSSSFPTKSYVFDLANSSSASFSNSDAFIFDIHTF